MSDALAAESKDFQREVLGYMSDLKKGDLTDLKVLNGTMTDLQRLHKRTINALQASNHDFIARNDLRSHQYFNPKDPDIKAIHDKYFHTPANDDDDRVYYRDEEKLPTIQKPACTRQRLGRVGNNGVRRSARLSPPQAASSSAVSQVKHAESKNSGRSAPPQVASVSQVKQAAVKNSRRMARRRKRANYNGMDVDSQSDSDSDWTP